MAESTDTRSATRARIVDVAARMLAVEGPAAVTTRAVAEGAGVQAPTIYRLFGDKEGLLEAVAEHVMAAHVSHKTALEAESVAADHDPLDDLHTSWTAQIDFGLANPAVFRMLSDPSRVLHSPAAQSGQRVLEGRVHRVATTGRLRVSERRAVAMVQAAGVGTIQVLLATPAEQRDPGLAASIYDAVLARILTDPPAHEDDGTMAAVVAFRTLAPRLEVLSAPERRLLAEWLDRVISEGG
ncbi:MAG: TetR/AcrR family transcriptional regulator [Janthinobacterium lividum]